MDQQRIPFQDNLIIRSQPDQSGQSGQSGQPGQHYYFQSSYEIVINDCLVRGIINRDDQQFLHLDINGTDAQVIISEFVTDVAAAVGLIKTIKISNLALEVSGQGQSQSQNVAARHADVTIEWRSFTIDGQNIGLDLSLTGMKYKTKSKAPDQVLDLIKSTSVKTIEPALVPKLYRLEENLNISITLS
jgi:hypothetical protein